MSTYSAIIIFAAIVSGNVREPGTSLFVSGQSDLDNARSIAKEKYESLPSDPENQMTFARLIKNGDSARSIYRKVIANDEAPDSLRAEAYYRLACMSYMAANYQKAETYCAHACSLDKRDLYERLLGRATLLANPDSSEYSLKRIQETGKKGGSSTENNEKKMEAAAYYLQIAAFAEVENAHGLKKDLMRLFPKVVIMEGISHGKNIYRVRIGPFANMSDAQVYGDSALVKYKISFRIVEE